MEFLPRFQGGHLIPLFIDNQACLSVTNHPNNSTKSRHIALREFRIRDYHELGMIRPYWCPGNYNVADFFSKLLEKGLFTMHAHRFGMNFEETIVGKLTELYQTVHLKEFTDFPKKDETLRRIQQRYLRIFISRRNQLLMRPITCHMDIASE